MRVLIDTTYARRAPNSGTGIYIRMLCAELKKLDGIELVEVANRRRGKPGGGGAASLRNLGSDIWWTSVALPRLARSAGVQLIHHPLPALCPVAPVPQVVTILDLSFERLPQCFDRRFRAYAHLTHRAAARAAGAVISISETTARDAQEVWGLPAVRIVVARLGPGQDLVVPGETAERAPTHFLYVGDDEPRKDLRTLLEAYDRYRAAHEAPLELVLAGSASAKRDGVRLERAPEPDWLVELYASAAALVQPSLYEGFGLTAVEAMKLGVPVVAARSPGLVEVGGDAVRYVEQSDVDGLADAMSELADNPRVRHELAERGRRRASEFSWVRCARDHRDAYSLALRR